MNIDTIIEIGIECIVSRLVMEYAYETWLDRAASYEASLDEAASDEEYVAEDYCDPTYWDL